MPILLRRLKIDDYFASSRSEWLFKSIRIDD